VLECCYIAIEIIASHSALLQLVIGRLLFGSVGVGADEIG
jgi:hypothetical protein